MQLSKLKNLMLILTLKNFNRVVRNVTFDRYLISTNQQKIVFVAKTRPLVKQQADYFSDDLSNTTLHDDKVVREITGDLNFNAWEKEQWDEALSNCHVRNFTFWN